MSLASEPVDTHGDRYGNAFLLSDAPDNRLPDVGMPAVDAMRLLGEELVLDGIPWRNLATFVTTWMEPEAQRIIAENLHRNYIGNAQHVTIMRALVKQTLGHARVSTLADDIVQAVATLSAKGGLHELDRQRVKTGTGY